MALATDFAIITPSEVKFEGKAEIVVAPGAAGDLAALANHAPLLTTLRIGVVRATVTSATDAEQANRRVAYAVKGGFMQILPNKVLVLSDMALSDSEIDVAAARADLNRAEAKDAQWADERAQRDAVAWASARLEVAQP